MSGAAHTAGQFVYLECPDCGYDAVILKSVDTHTRYCPLCAGDNGRDVAMRKGDDIPATVEGPDARAAIAKAEGAK